MNDRLDPNKGSGFYYWELWNAVTPTVKMLIGIIAVAGVVGGMYVSLNSSIAVLERDMQSEITARKEQITRSEDTINKRIDTLEVNIKAQFANLNTSMSNRLDRLDRTTENVQNLAYMLLGGTRAQELPDWPELPNTLREEFQP